MGDFPCYTSDDPKSCLDIRDCKYKRAGYNWASCLAGKNTHDAIAKAGDRRMPLIDTRPACSEDDTPFKGHLHRHKWRRLLKFPNPAGSIRVKCERCGMRASEYAGQDRVVWGPPDNPTQQDTNPTILPYAGGE